MEATNTQKTEELKMGKVEKIEPKKQIIIEHKGREYTLEFTRETVSTLERNGFNIEELGKKSVSTMPILFAGAFLANHKHLNRNVINEIYDKIHNRIELMAKLSELYYEPLNTLIVEDEPVSEGEQGWKATF